MRSEEFGWIWELRLLLYTSLIILLLHFTIIVQLVTDSNVG